MGNEIAVQKDSVIQAVDMGTLTEYMDATGLTKQLLPSEKTMFINMAQLYGLNPFKREIYCNVYGQGQYRQCSIITGYEVYLKRAERIGKLDGWHTEEVGNLKDGTFGVKVIIYRKDWSHAFEHTAYYNEVKQTKKDGTPNRFWAQQPRFMTKKVAVAQAFRMCFPDEFGGMPYLNDELGIETSAPVIENITPPREPVEEVRSEHVPKQAGPSDAYLMLEALLNEHGMELHGKPFQLANECLKNPDSTNDDLEQMRLRCITYLGKKGIRVA